MEHFSHNHILNFRQWSEGVYVCLGCHQLISGPAYVCDTCKIGMQFVLHKSCAELPREIRHPPPSQHLKLTLLTEPPSSAKSFICDVCTYVSYGFNYHCSECQLNLDTECASSNRNFDSVQRLKDREKNRTFHFSHKHALTICQYKKEFRYDCKICDRPLSGMSYGCPDCDFFFHKSCRDVPQTIQHPTHPLHPLRRLDFVHMKYGGDCDACKLDIDDIIPFRCDECDFNLHVQCAYSLMCILKHECHPHGLLYLASADIQDSDYDFPCNTCGAPDCKEDGNFYRCVQCDLNFHFECVPIPRVIKHRSHLHSLTLMDSFVEDDSGEYYCDVCETERNPKHHVYCCEECPFVAHIHCVLFEEETSSKMVFSLVPYIKDGEALELKGMEQREVKQETKAEYTGLVEPNKSQIEHVSHRHAFRLCEVLVNNEDPYNCKMCNLEIHGSAYVCESCEFWVHKSCAELPHEMLKHPLHQNCVHPLTLLTGSPNSPHLFICDNCRDICSGFNFYCRSCGFTLDIKCASPVEDGPSSYSQDRRLKERGQKTSIVHFTHKHELALANFTSCIPDLGWVACSICSHFISGQSCYCCLDCRFFFHESCLQYPKELQHPFHSPHPLQLDFATSYNYNCNACGLRSGTFNYCCNKCDLILHVECADSLVFNLKHKRHVHDLFYYHGDFHELFFSRHVKFPCDICTKICISSFYRCVECKLNFHLECLPLPHIVKHKRHWHPLTLMDSVVEDDSGEYYCEICETERNPKHHVYYCEQCTYIAHIECILSKENTSSEVLLCLTNEENDTKQKKVVEQEPDAEGSALIEKS